MLLHRAVLSQSQRTPHAPAIFYEGEVWSYQDIVAKARSVAASLQSRQVAQGDPVALAQHAGPEAVAAILGIHMAGGAYVPIDIDMPEVRRARTFEQSGCKVAVFASDETDPLTVLPEAVPVSMADLEDEGRFSEVEDGADDDLAYIIFTSGTTGTPKGVAISHGAAWNTIADINARWSVGATDRALALSALSFDLSVYDIFGLLSVGGALVIPHHNHRREPATWLKLMQDHHVTLWNSVPALMDMATAYLDGVNPQKADLRLVLMSGDWVPLALPDRVKQLFGEPTVVALGGATEASIWSNFFEIEDVPNGWKSIPYGRALSGQSMIVLTPDLTQAAVGEEGELFIGGQGLAREYWKDPKRTAESFIDTDAWGRLYRTGDLGRLLPSGELEFLGRLDTQVKVGGHRIELGDVEAALLEHPDVGAAVCKLVASGRNQSAIAAFIVSKDRGAMDADTVIRFAADRLPHYMVPSSCDLIDALPLTRNGKVDRAALQPSVRRSDAKSVDDDIYRIVVSVLETEEIGDDENLFDLGAQSLSAVRILALVRDTLGVELLLKDVFENPTIGQLRQRIADAGPAKAPRKRVADYPPSPRASFNQEQVCFLSSFFPLNRAYNFQATVRFRGALDVARLEQAIDAVIERHEMLRTTIHAGEDGYTSVIHPPYHLPIGVHDLVGLSEDAQISNLNALLEATLNGTFDVEVLPLLRFEAVRLAPDDWVLIQIEHHVVHDGWSIGKIWAEIQEIYSALLEARAPVLPELPLQYQQFVAWQRENLSGEYGREALQFWREHLDGTDMEVRLSHEQAEAEVMGGHNVRTEISAERYGQVREVAARYGVSEFAVLFSVFGLFMSRQTGATDFCVGTATSARTEHDIEPLIGMIVNIIPVRVALQGATSLSGSLEAVHGSLLSALRYQDTPLSLIVRDLGLTQSEGRNPVFQHCFSFHDSAMPSFKLGDVQGEIHEEQNQTAKFDLNAIVIPPGPTRSARHARVLWEFAARSFTQQQAEFFAHEYMSLLDSALADPDRMLLNPGMMGLTATRSTPARPAAAAMPIAAVANGGGDGIYTDVLLDIFKDVLKSDDIGVDTNVFECGCHSLAAIRAAALFKRETGEVLKVRIVFDNPTVRGMSSALSAL